MGADLVFCGINSGLAWTRCAALPIARGRWPRRAWRDGLVKVRRCRGGRRRSPTSQPSRPRSPSEVSMRTSSHAQRERERKHRTHLHPWPCLRSPSTHPLTTSAIESLLSQEATPSSQCQVKKGRCTTGAHSTGAPQPPSPKSSRSVSPACQHAFSPSHSSRSRRKAWRSSRR
jgi:hypothetical protein